MCIKDTSLQAPRDSVSSSKGWQMPVLYPRSSLMDDECWNVKN